MKKFKFLIVFAALALLTQSCRKTLELAPEDYFASNSFWKNESQVTNFMVGLHKQFQGSQFMFMRLGEMRGGAFSDVDRTGASLQELPIIQQNLSENNSGISNWANFYSPILQLNLFIDKVEPISFLPAAKKSYLLGQAYAMRAFYYFQLLRTYGGVPLRLTPEVITNTDPVTLRMARSSEADVLAAIKSDVNTAVTNFGSAATISKNQFNPKAALMLKGEVYLWSAKVYGNTADLVEAKTALQAISGTSLMSNFSNVFGYSYKNNNEIIFSIHNGVGESEMNGVNLFTYATFNFDNLNYKDSAVSAGVGNFLVDPLNIGNSNSLQVIQRYGYTFELFKSYDLADTRRNATFYDYYKVNTGVSPYVVEIRNTALVKFLGTITTEKRYFSDDWPVYREADRLLMLAEIVNAEGGDPTQYIKAIRDRAFGGAANDPTPFVNGTKDANELAIFAERSKEFVYEGKRWYDLRRMKYGNDPLVFKSLNHPYGVLDKATEAHKVLWPIDANVWTDDPLVDQTPGYPTAK